MKIEFKEKNLFIDNLMIPFDRKIWNILILNNGIIVLLHVYTVKGKMDEQNVYFVKFDGKIKWQIEHNSMPDKNIGYQGFTDISLDDDGSLRVYSFLGLSCIVDIETGKILSREVAK